VTWILRQVWWQWDATASGDVFSQIYHWFNLAESAAWFAFGGMVILRWSTWRWSPLELFYAAAFVVFGITDVIEAWQQSTVLILFKLINLVALFTLRRRVMPSYPEARLF